MAFIVGGQAYYTEQVQTDSQSYYGWAFACVWAFGLAIPLLMITLLVAIPPYDEKEGTTEHGKMPPTPASVPMTPMRGSDTDVVIVVESPSGPRV